MTAPLGILHLASEMHGAGSTISISLLARAQQGAGHRVLVAAPAGSALLARAQAAGLDTQAMDFTDPRAAARAVAALAAGRGADVINAHASRDRAACRRARFARALPAALVMTRRVMPRSSPFAAIASGLASDRVIAVSRPVARALVRRGTLPSRVRVVHNAVDHARFQPPPTKPEIAAARAAAGTHHGRPTIGIVGRRKDHDVLLLALLKLRVPVTVCCLGIAADAALTVLTRRVERGGHRVSFVPFQDDVRAFYAIFDVAALPSRTEGCSQALLEAMALGVPVVASAAGGNADLIVDGEHGLLVPPRVPALFARALARMLLDAPARDRMRAAAKARVDSEFTIARTLALTDAVYREAIARRRG